jgi:hypothetical protein
MAELRGRAVDAAILGAPWLAVPPVYESATGVYAAATAIARTPPSLNSTDEGAMRTGSASCGRGP